MGLLSRKKEKIEEDLELDDEDEDEESDDEPIKKPKKKEADVSKEEIRDLIQGNLNRLSQLVDVYLRS
jgi:TATA-binding protein-associated factor Taf7